MTTRTDWHGRYDPAALLDACQRLLGPGATTRQIADVAGVTRRTVFRWRAGQRSMRVHAIADRVEAATGVLIYDLERDDR